MGRGGKMKLFNRFMLLIITLSFMFISLLLAIYSFGLVQYSSLPDIIEGFHAQIELGILFLAAFILAAMVIYPFFTRSSKRKATIVNNSELGEVDITLEALENLVQGVSIQQEEIEDIKTNLIATENGVLIKLNGKVHPDTVIPELTTKLQKIIKNYLEDTTGVNVEEVKILIKDVYQKQKPEEKEITPPENTKE